jgi:triacylglycerol lipase
VKKEVKMKSIRKKALIASIIEFFVFSFVGFSLVLMLFHAGIFAFPVIAFMWTFWGFNVLTFFIGIKIKLRYRLSFAVLNFLVISLLLAYLINSTESIKNNTVQIVSIAVSIVVALLYLLVSILFVKHYWNPAKNEVLRLFGKNPPEPTLDDCKTKYPLLLVHGTGFRDRKLFNYWGLIPDFLEEHGAAIFYSKHDAWANIEDAANQIVIALKEALEKTGSEKVNVIAHSKGGIDVRYAIAKLGVSDKIASLTMISSPNHGLKTMDSLYSIFGKRFFKFCAFFVNIWFRILGDKKPDFFETSQQFRASFMENFNKEIIDFPAIMYQSFAGKMKNPFSDIFMWFLNLIINFSDGANDGLVSVDSAKWGKFRGTIEGRRFFGISHPHEVDGYRTNPRLKEIESLPSGSKTIRDFYINLVRELKDTGF